VTSIESPSVPQRATHAHEDLVRSTSIQTQSGGSGLSVLMSVYRKDDPGFLREALESLEHQTLPADEIVIVVDGPVSAELDAILDDFAARYADGQVTLHRLAQNQGLASAMNVGLKLATRPLVARMDSDDYCDPKRFERQVAFLAEHPDIGCVATIQAEFETDPTLIVAEKGVPATHEKIVQALWFRNVISHPSVAFRRHLLLAAGGYRTDVGLLEDYELHFRLIQQGVRYAGIQEPLIRVRISPQQRFRRGGWKYARHEWAMRAECYRRGQLPWFAFWVSTPLSTLFRLSPVWLKRLAYALVRRPTRSVASRPAIERNTLPLA
jgi:glycosyltransferase involved in cell wall biosynthesis